MEEIQTFADISSLKPAPGTYALILRSDSNASVQVGRWGRIALTLGYYIYVGSAFGPGGVKARVSRHWRMGKRVHWHIDYLRDFVTPTVVWVSYEPEHLEHQWAQVLCETEGINSTVGFGCSDCKCDSHLFHCSRQPDISLLSSAVDYNIIVYEADQCKS